MVSPVCIYYAKEVAFVLAEVYIPGFSCSLLSDLGRRLLTKSGPEKRPNARNVSQ